MDAGNERPRIVAAIGKRLSYANVMATIAVFGVLATGGAYAASKIGPKDIAKNAVRAKHIKKKQIKGKHIKKKAVKAKHVKENAVRARHIRDGAVSEAKLAEGVLAGLEARIGELEGTVAAQAATIAALEGDVGALQALLAGVSRQTIDGNDTLRLSGMNLQLVNGTGFTGSTNSLGNLIIGYNAQRPAPPLATRTGSHYLVVGSQHEWTRFGGILAGFRNTSSGDRASVTGGRNNTASGTDTSVTGGLGNTADGTRAAVLGGDGNTASGDEASVSGGGNNTAGGTGASILGGSSETEPTDFECGPLAC